MVTPMATLAIKHELLHEVSNLPESLQLRVLQFARALVMTKQTGVAGSSLLPFAGCISQDDLSAISGAIKEGCDRIDANEW